MKRPENFPIGAEPIRRALGCDFRGLPHDGELDLEKIRILSAVVAASSYFGIPAEDILGRERTAAVVEARNVAMYAAHKVYPRIRPEAISEAFDGRNRTTYYHSITYVEDATSVEPAFRNDVEIVVRAVENARFGI